MDFSKFEPVESSNTRKSGGGFPKGQEYKHARYKALEKKSDDGTSLGLEGKVSFSNAQFEALDLDNHGMKQFIERDSATKQIKDMLIAVVSDNDATVFKKTNKGKGGKTKSFKSSRIEQALSELGLIDTKAVGVSQVLDMVEVPEAKGVVIKGVTIVRGFRFVAGEKIVRVKKEKGAEVLAPADGAPILKAAPKPQAAKVAPAAAADEW